MNSESSAPKSFTRFVPVILRVLLGLALVVFGLNGFLNFIPPPPTALPDKAEAFATALFNSGYMLKLIGATHLFVGLCLLTNRFVPLALVIFAAFMVNSLAFHLFLEHSGLPMAIVFTAIMLYLAWVHRAAYRPLLTSRFTS